MTPAAYGRVKIKPRSPDQSLGTPWEVSARARTARGRGEERGGEA